MSGSLILLLKEDTLIGYTTDYHSTVVSAGGVRPGTAHPTGNPYRSSYFLHYVYGTCWDEDGVGYPSVIGFVDLGHMKTDLKEQGGEGADGSPC